MVRQIFEREDLIPKLAEIFRQHGYEGASIGLIVAETGAGRSSLYHFFPGGKEEMAAAVLDNVALWFETHIFTPLDTLPEAEAIPTMIRAVTEYFRSGQRICLVGAFALDRTRDLFAERIAQYFDRWLASLSGCLRRAGLPEDAAFARAAQTIAAIQGAIVLTRATARDGLFHEVVAQIAAPSPQLSQADAKDSPS